MEFSASMAQTSVARLISVAIILQTLELWWLRKTVSENGVWRWNQLREDFCFLPDMLRFWGDRIMGYSGVIGLLSLRFISAVGVWVYPHPLIFVVLFLTSLLLSLRWGGTFNGGSDSMTLLILLTTTLASIFPDVPGVSLGCLWYISIQTCLSYFVAGMAKLKSRNWRNGRALVVFMERASCLPLTGATSLWQGGMGWGACVASWLVILFEGGFPLALMNPHLGLFFLGGGLLFHLTNAYLLGLNRFVFVWAAAYPALYFCSQSWQK
jgi:hypothetical protein